jgi:hypothetical protein
LLEPVWGEKSICLTAAGLLRYKIVGAARSCAAKNSEDDDVQLHTEFGGAGRFFLI